MQSQMCSDLRQKLLEEHHDLPFDHHDLPHDHHDLTMVIMTIMTCHHDLPFAGHFGTKKMVQ